MNIAKNTLFLAFLSLFLLGSKGCFNKNSASSKESRASIAQEKLLEKRDAAKAQKNAEQVVAALEQLVLQYPEAEENKAWRVELGQAYLDQGNLELAYRVFKDYTKLFPSDEKSETVFYQAISAKYAQTVRLRNECDTKEAEKTIHLCKKYLARPTFKAHRDDVTDIQKTCENRLVNKEVYIFDTYLLQGKFASAKTRLESFKDLFVAKNPNLEAQALFLECKLARHENKPETAQQIYSKLQQHHSSSPFTKMAMGQTKAIA